MAQGGFELRKWASNKEEVLEGMPREKSAMQKTFDFDRDQSIKTLGLHWEPASDCLKYNIQMVPVDSLVLTKRLTLSFIARLFDPLGLVGPVVVVAKIFMQTLWTIKDENGNVWPWDKELPPSLKQRWVEYHQQLPQLNTLRIDRFVGLSGGASITLHFFSDASEGAYGSCAYVRSRDERGEIN